MTRKSKAQPRGPVPLYQIKITLKWSKPPIWRRFVVRADMPLNRFHDLIQIVMGWTNSHLHHFVVGRVFYGSRDTEFGGMESDELDEKRYRVADLAPAAKSKFIYEYDFGDGWIHDLIVEKILPPDAAFKHPACLAGANACPPEDCGGMGGYDELLRTLADPNHPEHEDMKEWIGGEFDPASFNLNQINAVLARLKA